MVGAKVSVLLTNGFCVSKRIHRFRWKYLEETESQVIPSSPQKSMRHKKRQQRCREPYYLRGQHHNLNDVLVQGKPDRPPAHLPPRSPTRTPHCSCPSPSPSRSRSCICPRSAQSDRSRVCEIRADFEIHPGNYMGRRTAFSVEGQLGPCWLVHAPVRESVGELPDETDLDLFQVAPHLVVELGEPVRHPKLEMTPRSADATETRVRSTMHIRAKHKKTKPKTREMVREVGKK